MKLLQNKFFLICVCIALVLVVVTSTFSLMGYRALARDIIGTVTMPVRWCVTAVTNAFEGFARQFQSVDQLMEQNQKLEDENNALKGQIEQAQMLERENELLKAYLGIKNEHPSFVLEEGCVVGRESGNYISVLTLNRGSYHGIKRSMAVITPDGIVGYVSEVGMNWCKVSTLMETASSVGAYIPRSGVSGMVEGDYSMRYEGNCKMTYLSADADIQIGDTVYSSGIGSVYPADLPIGKVIDITVDEYSRTLTATVKPLADYNAKYMAVIKDYEDVPSKMEDTDVSDETDGEVGVG
jgi:rod shape-determining protein MreC